MVTLLKVECQSLHLLQTVALIILIMAKFNVSHLFCINKDDERFSSSKFVSQKLDRHRTSKLTSDTHVATDRDTETLRNAGISSDRVEMGPPFALVEETRTGRCTWRDWGTLLTVEPLGHLFELLLVEHHFSESALVAHLALNSLRFVIKINRLVFTHGTIRAVAVLVLRHALGASVAGNLFPRWKLSNC